MSSVQQRPAGTLLKSFDLSGKTAILTGGHGDLAEAIAGALAELGCAVVLAARRVEACESLAQRLETHYGVRMLPVAVDVTRADEIEHLVSSALEEFGTIDVLVNSAATFWSAPAEDVPLERGWQRVLDTNLTGTFLSCQAAGRAMLRAGSGSIINVAATGGIKSFLPEMGPNLSYMTSKAAVIKLTRDLAAQWANRGVRVNAIAPGFDRGRNDAEPPRRQARADGCPDPDAPAGPARRATRRRRVPRLGCVELRDRDSGRRRRRPEHRLVGDDACEIALAETIPPDMI